MKKILKKKKIVRDKKPTSHKLLEQKEYFCIIL